MSDFFETPLYIIISTSISFIGLLGTVLGIYQYLKSTKELREYKYLFKVAGQHVDLEDQKNKIDNYEKQISQMQNALQKQIPMEAKKIALKGILDNEMQALSTTYTKVQSLQSELKSLNTNDMADTENLMKDINKIIEPNYSQKRLSNLLSTMFYLVSIVSSSLSMILPYRLYRTVTVIILLFQLVIGIRLILNTIKSNYTRDEIMKFTKKVPLFLFVSSFFALIFVFVFVLLMSERDYVNEDSFLILITILFTLHIVFGIMHFSNLKKRWLIIWLSFSSLTLASAIALFLLNTLIFFAFLFAFSLANLIFLLICLLKNLS